MTDKTYSKERTGRFTKKPVTIDAWLIDFGNKPLPDWVNDAFRAEAIDWCPAGEGLYINTLEGHMRGTNGSWLIKGVQGELYACKPDIFAETYERASIAASAGSEPVATVFTMEALAPGGGVKCHATVHKPLPAGTKLYTHPSPPEGMVGGWVSVEERLPPPFEEVVVYPRPDDYCCEAFCDTAGKWKWAEYEHNFGVHHRECQVEYWLMLPEVPAPPTTSAGSRKGE